jgi:hypothetical protein
LVDGGCEAADYLESLPEDVRLRIHAVVRRLADERFIPNRQKFNRLDAGIYELKLRRPPVRLFCFQSGPDWVCTHGDRKPGQSELGAHVAKVKELRKRYLEERA